MTSDDAARVRVFDTTLRDGEQSPGASLALEGKLEMARALRDLGVDVIEAGFPSSSQGDFAAVRAVAREIHGPVVAALARCHRADIERAWEAVRENPRPRLHVFLATSPLHRRYKLGLEPAEVARRAEAGVARARELAGDVEFSAEDASRTEPEFLAEVIERAIAAGATTINVPDTVGYALPGPYGALFAHLRRTVRGINAVTLSAHCHDDLGLAVANSLAALEHGARQVECTINGIGERAGNAALEEVVMALAAREEHFGLATGIVTERLQATSHLLIRLTGLAVARHKAVVGENAFAHEAGIHQHGVLAHPATYEILRPRDVGAAGSALVLGKHSGRHALRARLGSLGFELDEGTLEGIFAAFKQLADRQRAIDDADLRALVAHASSSPTPGAAREAV